MNYLNRQNIYFIATFNKSRKGFPHKIKKLYVEKGGEKYFEIKNTKIKLYIKNKGDKFLNLCSNVFRFNKVNYKNKCNKYKEKREINAIYNLTKGGVDQIDQRIGLYNLQRKSYQWWKEVYLYLLDITISNSMKIYYSFSGNKNNVNNLMYNFRIQLLYEYHDYIFRIIELKKILKETDSNKKQNISIKINKEQIKHEYISTGDLIRKDCSLCKLVGKMDKYRHYNKTNKRCTACEFDYMCKNCYQYFHENEKLI